MTLAQTNPVIEHFGDLAQSTGAFTVREHHPDAHSISLSLPSGSLVHFSIESRARISPQEVWGIINRYRALKDTNQSIVLYAPVISPRVAQICREHQMGYLDASGNCHFQAPGFLVHVQGRKLKHREPRQRIDLFARKSSRVIRVMLEDVSKGWLLKSLPHNAGVSPALVTHVSRALIQESYAEFRDRHLFIRDPERLLEAWALAYKPSQRRMYYVMQDFETTKTILENWATRYSAKFALGGLSGAWLAAPMVKPVMLSCYIANPTPSPVNLVPETPLRLQPVDSGANLAIDVPNDEYVFYGARTINGTAVVSPIQLYLDLSKNPGRGEEAAKEILEKELLPQWRA
jgi:hypothetical protein